MDAKELAGIINNCDISREMRDVPLDQVKASGLAIVFGASDDLLEFRGAIEDEAGCYGTGTIYFNRSGELRSKCDSDECPYFEKTKATASKIKAIWDSEGYSWVYETNFLHETFDVLEDGEKYCRGIVFSIYDVKDD